MRRNVIDRMALLCTLHADGPKTLRLLREAGCTTIKKISELPAEKVGRVLNLAPAAARRFTREARHLQERLEPDLEQEEVTYPPAAQPMAAKPAPPGQLVEEPLQEEASEQVTAEPDLSPSPRALPRSRSREHLDLRDRKLLDHVAQRWREEEPPTRAEPQVSDSESLRVLQILGGEVHDLIPEPAMERSKEAEEEPCQLRAGDLQGLDEEVCGVLQRGGILSLDDLATIPVDELVKRSCLTFSRARTLQYLAGREITRRSEERLAREPLMAGPETQERLSPRETPTAFDSLDFEFEPILGEDEPRPGVGRESFSRDRGHDGGVAGPFA